MLGTLYILYGPPGAGKSTLLKLLTSRISNLEPALLHTTRQAQIGERHGIDFHFIHEKEFNNHAKKENFLLSFEKHKDHYGFLKQTTFECLQKGIDLILEMNNPCISNIKKQIKDCCTIFIIPASLNILNERVARQSEEKLRTNKHMQATQSWVAQYFLYDHLIINHENNLEEAYEQIKAIVLSNRTRTFTQEIHNQQILENYGALPIFHHILKTHALKNINPYEIKFIKAGADTDVNYIVSINGVKTYCLRVSREDNKLDREIERHNTKLASKYGLYPKIHHFSVASGLQLTDYIENDGTLTSEIIRKNEYWIFAVAKKLAKLHNIKEKAKGNVNFLPYFYTTFKNLETHKKRSTEKLKPLFEEIKDLISLLEGTPHEITLCHNDPHPGNFLILSNTKLILIDWEYATLNDPLYDLGKFSALAMLTPEQEKKLLEYYQKERSIEVNMNRILLYKPIAYFLLGVWAMHKQYNRDFFTQGEISEKASFENFIDIQLRACRKIIESNAFLVAKKSLKIILNDEKITL